MSLYRVSGTRPFRRHPPGSTFVGRLEPSIEARAIARGDIEILEGAVIALDPTRATLPEGWAVARLDSERSAY